MIDTMMKQETENYKDSGFTLIEMLVSILVGTIVISILMQQLVMTVGIKRDFELDNRMSNESYYIAEQIKFNIFNLQPHSIEIISDTATQTVINIVHEYDIESGAGNIIVRNYSNPVTDVLIWDKVNEELTYNSETFHSANIKIADGSSLTLIRIDPDLCLIDPGNEVCGEGILRLELVIQVELEDGSRLDPKTFITTIIV